MADPVSVTAISVADSVRDALDRGLPIVALESTFFTHGLPKPRNLAVARQAEELVSQAGALPATIGIVDGVPTVGLTDNDIERLSTMESPYKVTTRDLPIAAAKQFSGGTTVAATAFLAHKVGINVFSTGGLGGVHHGAESTFDESADLIALATTPITVVSAGVKSILNVSATLERLETLNIPVVGYRTTRYPGFYVADSGHEIEYSVDTADEVAVMIAARAELGIKSALLVANPVPENEQMDPELHKNLINEAWNAAERAGISGKETTPFLLDYIQRTTEGMSLEVNVAAYRNNIAVGSAIARALTS